MNIRSSAGEGDRVRLFGAGDVPARADVSISGEPCKDLGVN